jgi:hypothetical protein
MVSGQLVKSKYHTYHIQYNISIIYRIQNNISYTSGPHTEQLYCKPRGGGPGLADPVHVERIRIRPLKRSGFDYFPHPLGLEQFKSTVLKSLEQCFRQFAYAYLKYFFPFQCPFKCWIHIAAYIPRYWSCFLYRRVLCTIYSVYHLNQHVSAVLMCELKNCWVISANGWSYDKRLAVYSCTRTYTCLHHC